MKLLNWNCRGLGNPTTIRALKKILQKEKHVLVFLTETKLKCEEMRRVNSSNLKYDGCFVVSCEGQMRARRGGLCMLWKLEVELDLISFSHHHTSFKVKDHSINTNWICTGMYGWPEQSEKHRTWKLLRDINRGDQDPWLCMGDFNQIMWSHEKKGGNMGSWSNMREFRDTLRDGNLIDMGFKGSPFTWSNGRRGANLIRERLDRGVSNPRWKRLYPNATVQHLPRYKSDHAPLVIDCEDLGDARPRIMNRFRFEHMWLQHSNFENILKDSWNQSMTDSFGEQVSLCGTSLSKWANKEFGSVRKRKKELTEKLEELQKNEDNEERADEMKQVELELDQVLKLEETMWFQRSRTLWLKDGDRNSAFFHEKASHRRRRNTIKKLVDENSTEITKQEEIVKMVRDYFMTIFNSEGVGENIAVLEALECKVTSDMNETLTKPYTEEEIRSAIKQMHPAKAPGPDGMTPLFYQKFWHVINSDVLHAVLGILNNAKDPSSLNHTHITTRISFIDNYK